MGAIIAAEIVADYTKAQAEIKKAEKDIKELGETADKTSDQLDEAGDSMGDLGDKSKETGGKIDANNVNLASQMIALEGVTSALNQTTGGLNKMIGGMEASNLINEKQAAQLQKNVRQMELVTGGLEVLIAIKKLDTVITAAWSSMNIVGSASTWSLTGAVSALNAAMWANPIMAVVGAAILLTVILIGLEMKFGLVTKSVEAAKEAMDAFKDAVAGTVDWIMGLDDAAINFVEGGLEKLGPLGDLIGGGGALA